MPFEHGRQKTGGRRVGTSNRFTGVFREAVHTVYNGLGGHAAFLEWAKENKSEYYRIAARLIPGEMREDSGDQPIRVIVYGPTTPVLDVQPEAIPDRSLKGPDAYDRAR